MLTKISTNLISYLLLIFTLLVGSNLYAQERSVSGTIIDLETNEPLPGVNVLAKGTTLGTVTDVEGNYRFTLDDNVNTLIFSSIGYLTEEVIIGTRSEIDLSLVPDIQSLSEVVVVGYGTQQRRDITSAISSIDAEEIGQLAIQGVDQAIQGRVAGVRVTQNSGEPGGGLSVRIRGLGSNRNNEPLYVVDGFPLEGAIGNSINPSDIESIDILKDAAAAAIYGARGANGVVLITTKRGAEQKTQVSFNAYYGVQEAWNLPEMLNAQEFATLHSEVFAGTDIPINPEWADPAALGEGTDWLDAIFRAAPIQEYNLALSGGGEKLQTRLSIGYLNQQGIVISSGFERYSLRANLDYTVNDNIKIGANITPTYIRQDEVPNGEGFSSDIILSAQKMIPTLGLRDPIPQDGRYYAQAQMAQPIFLAESVDGRSENFRTLTNAFLDVKFLKNFTYRLNVGADLAINKGYLTVPTLVEEGGGGLGASFPFNQISTSYGDNLTWLVENTLNYDITLAGKHTINVLAGHTVQKSTNMGIGVTGQNFLNDEIRSISAGLIRDGGGSLQTGWAIESLLGRISYDYDDRYLLAASVRRDGSSRFDRDFRYGVFPSVSAGWRVSGENFMSSVPFLEDLKLRASWGRLGNDRIADFQYLNAYSVGDVFGYTLGTNQTVNQGGVLTRLGRRDLTWETSEQLNFGVDLALFGNVITFTTDYFVKSTKDLLLNQPLPSTVGVSSTFVNAGEVRNTGWEFVLGHRNQIGDFSYGISANFTAIQNEVIDLNQELEEGEDSFPPTFLTSGFLAGATTESRVGEPFGYYRGYIVDGVIQNEGEIPAHLEGFSPGDFLYRDINEDGALNEQDIAKIGDPFPDFEFGLNLNADYKGFDLNLFIQGVQGNDVLLVTKRRTHNPGVTNGWKQSLDRWHGEGTSNSSPGLSRSNFRSFETPSTWFVEDGSYIRCKNLEVGYSLNSNVLESVRLSNLRVYASAQNLFTITDYPGFDPEIGGSSALASGIDIGRYPSARLYRIGVNVTF